nr:protein YLS3-like [Ipomoea batatas]
MKTRTISVLLILVFLAAGGVNSDTSKDKEECTESLVGLATCLLYVGGNAPSPTPDCCNGLKQVLKSSKKCLCLLIKDRNDPQLGLSINLTLALGLPSACHAPSNISECPALLHLPPKSPDAQVFYQFGHASSPADTPIPSEGGPASAPQKSGGLRCIGRTWLALETILPLSGLILLGTSTL